MATKRKRSVKRKTHCKRCCSRRSHQSFEDSMIGTCRTGARVVIAAGMLGAIGECVDGD